jgi:hypothetical protein
VEIFLELRAVSLPKDQNLKGSETTPFFLLPDCRRDNTPPEECICAFSPYSIKLRKSEKDAVIPNFFSTLRK